MANLETLQSLAKLRGGHLISKKYSGYTAYYKWKCSEGHTWLATPTGIGTKRWCPKCGAKQRAKAKTLSTKEINKKLALRGLKLVGEYEFQKKLQNCVCTVCGKPTLANYQRTPKGVGCRDCLRRIQPKYRLNDPHKIKTELLKYRIELKSNYLGVSKPLSLKCLKCNQEFKKTLDQLRINKRHLCEITNEYKVEKIAKYLLKYHFELTSNPVSATNALKIVCQKCNTKEKITFQRFKTRKFKCSECKNIKKYAELLKYVSSKNGILLTKKYSGSHKKYRFECKYGHLWSAIPTKNSWCPECAGKNKNITHIRRLAQQRGGKLLSKDFIGVDQKYLFRCSVGHEFSMSFSKMQGGQWCSICTKGSKSEELVRTVMEQVFQSEFKRIRPNWLKNDRSSSMELDGYSEQLKIAFEYQGRQHYEVLKFLVDQDLIRIKLNDKLKSDICRKLNVNLFIFTYKDDYRNFASIAKAQAVDFGMDISKYDFEQKIDFNKAYIRVDKLEELKSRMASKGLTLLSKKWLGVEYYYSVKCKRCKKVYEVAGTAFMGKKINGCRFCALTENFNESTLDISTPIAFAQKKGGYLLDKEYKNMHFPMQWRCAKGHEFTARFNNMSRRDEFCAVCENRVRKNQFSLKTAKLEFKKYDLSLLEEYKGLVVAHRTKCSKCKNINSSRLTAIIKGSPPCLYCSGKRVDKKTAFATLKEFKLRPLEPYVNSYTPILCKCLICHKSKKFKVTNVKANSHGCSH
jgi:hypothetical protein